MRDRTEEHWLEGKKDYHITISPDNRRNILRNLIQVSENGQTIRAHFLNSDKPSILHYIRRSHWVNKNTGYIHDWDGVHVCDRCGKRLNADFTGCTLELVTFKDKMPGVAFLGLCHCCESTLEEELRDSRDRDIRDGLIYDSNKRLFLEPRVRRRNDFEEWMYLDSRRVSVTISDRM